MRAAEGTVLTQVTQEYPKRVTKKPHFTTKDWKLKASLKAMRHLQLQATWGGRPESSPVQSQTKDPLIQGLPNGPRPHPTDTETV